MYQNQFPSPTSETLPTIYDLPSENPEDMGLPKRPDWFISLGVAIDRRLWGHASSHGFTTARLGINDDCDLESIRNSYFGLFQPIGD